jgi:hypothetical protein
VPLATVAFGSLRTLELGRQISQRQTLSAAKIRPRLMQSACRTRRATRFLGGRQGPFLQHARRVPPAVSRVPQKAAFAHSNLPIKR